MKKLGILAFALFLIFAFGFQVYADDLSAGTTGTRNMGTGNGNGTGNAGTNMGTRGFDNDLGDTMDRTNTMNDNRGIGMRNDNDLNGYRTNNLRTNATEPTNNWGWLGILGLLGLAGMFGRNRNPER